MHHVSPRSYVALVVEVPWCVYCGWGVREGKKIGCNLKRIRYHPCALFNHASVEAECNRQVKGHLKAIRDAAEAPLPEDASEIKEYVRTVLTEGAYYSFSVPDGDEGSRTRRYCQVVSLNPERKASIEQITMMSVEQ